MEGNGSILLSTAYFAPIQFYSLSIDFDTVYIEQFENFTKQTYRNRSVILGANGPIPLVIPVVKGRGAKILIKDLKISYDVDWQRNHWRTIFSAYNSSPFFEFFKDDIQIFYRKREKFLLDYNLKIHETLCQLLEIGNNTVLTENFEKIPIETINCRELISPKNKSSDKHFQPQKYTQVFSEKFGFIPNLSILDLLFNEGANSFVILKESYNR